MNTQITILSTLSRITLLLYAHDKLKDFKLTRRFCLHNILLYTAIKNQKVSKTTYHRGNAPVNLEKPANFYKHKITATVCQPKSANQKYSYPYSEKKCTYSINFRGSIKCIAEINLLLNSPTKKYRCLQLFSWLKALFLRSHWLCIHFKFIVLKE